MTTRILWINPGLPLGDLDREFQEILDREKRPGTVVTVESTGRGPRDLEYRYYEALVIPDVLHRIVRAEQQGFDAVVVGCFYDPGLEAARELATLTVVGPAEASMCLAAALGHRFSIVIGRDSWIPQMMENVTRYGMREKLASFRSIGIPVREMRHDERRTAERIREEAARAVDEDGADVIILGCTMEYGLASGLQANLRVPVIDPVIAAFKTAEFRAELRSRYGWTTSKIRGYESPPIEQILEWNLGRTYGVEGLWEGPEEEEL